MEMLIIIGDAANNEQEMLNLGAVCTEWEYEDFSDEDDEDDLMIPVPPDEESEDEDEDDATIKGTLRMNLSEGLDGGGQFTAAIQEYMQYNADPTHMTITIAYSLNGVPVYSHICEGGYLDLIQSGSNEPMILEMEVYDFDSFVPPVRKVSH